MKTQNLLIATLVVSALILTVLLLVVPQPRTAMADMVNSGADYTLLATSPQPGGEETLLTIIDNRSQRMLTYRITNTRVEAVAQGDLSRVFPQTR